MRDPARDAAAVLVLAGLCGVGLARARAALPALPPPCAARVEVRGPEGRTRLACAEDAARVAGEMGRPRTCPALLSVTRGDRIVVAGAGSCEAVRERMAGPALRLLELPIDIDGASVEDLEALPGIGPGLAARLMAARPFRSLAELREVPGIGPRRWAALAGAAVVDGSGGSAGGGATGRPAPR